DFRDGGCLARAWSDSVAMFHSESPRARRSPVSKRSRGVRTPAWRRTVCAAGWLGAGAAGWLACSGSDAPRSAATTEPGAPPAINADPSNGSPDLDEPPTAAPADPAAPLADPSRDSDGDEGEVRTGLDPAA